jgi:hypothetical protein
VERRFQLCAGERAFDGLTERTPVVPVSASTKVSSPAGLNVRVWSSTVDRNAMPVPMP